MQITYMHPTMKALYKMVIYTNSMIMTQSTGYAVLLQDVRPSGNLSVLEMKVPGG